MFELITNIFSYLFLTILILFLCFYCTINLLNNLLVLYPITHKTRLLLPQYQSKFLLVRKFIIAFELLLLIVAIFLSKMNMVLLVISLTITALCVIIRYRFISQLSFDEKVCCCVDFLSTDVIDFSWIINHTNLSDETKNTCLKLHKTTMYNFYSNSLDLDKKQAFFAYIENLKKQGLSKDDIEKILISKPLKFEVFVIE